jgi:hypothetical protein
MSEQEQFYSLYDHLNALCQSKIEVSIFTNSVISHGFIKSVEGSVIKLGRESEGTAYNLIIPIDKINMVRIEARADE